MPTETIAPQSETNTSVSSQPSPVQTEPSSPAPEAPNSLAETSSADLSAQNFDSLEDYAQALLDQKQGESQSQSQSAAQPETEPEQQPAEAEQTEIEQPEQTEPEPAQQLNLEDDQVFSPRELNDRINSSPALRQALEADPELRNSMFRNARLASEAAKYKEVFPDVESAKYAMENAATFRQLDELFLNSATPEGATSFLQHWAGMAMLRDQQGNPIVENGLPRMHPAFSGFLDHINNRQMDFIRQKAEREGDQELLAAVDVIRERTSASSQPQDHELPPHLRAAAENIRRRELELNRQQLEQHRTAQTAFDQNVGREAQAKIDALINPVLEKAALSDFLRQTAREKIDSALLDALNKNRFFQTRMAELARSPRTAETRQQRLNLIISHVQSVAGPIVRQVLKEASAPVIARQQERQQKIEAQVARSRSEPRSTAGPSFTGRQKAPEQLFQQIRNQYIEEHGEEPSIHQLMELWAREKQ